MLPGFRSRFAFSALLGVLLLFTSLPTSASPRAGGQDDEKKEKQDKKSKKDKNKVPVNAPAASGAPMLWQDRGDVGSLDLYWGIGSEASAPKAPFTFDKEDVSGTNPKIKVIDANGVKWNVKFDEEVHAEVAASRIVWAAGYMVEESYFLPSAKVNGVTGLGRAKKFVGSDGSIANAMFEKRPDTIARRRINWDWSSNPFRGTKELSGLAILCAMLNNWDAKTTNNNVLGMFAADGTTVHDWYVVADSGGTLDLSYSGKGGSALKSVPIEHARWFAGIVGQLSDEQLRAAFRAAGATDVEVQGFSARLRQKIEELKRAVGQSGVAA